MLRLAEKPFITIQGEGPNYGLPTLFIRFATCNMRCAGWPCDTEYSWKAEFRSQWEKADVRDITDLIEQATSTGVRHVCITGGEPLLQPESELKHIFDFMNNYGLSWDIFTNGSRDFNPYVKRVSQTIVMDWKLPGSGEASSWLQQRHNNLELLSTWDAVKFVCKDEQDVIESQIILQRIRNVADVKIYYSPAWDEYSIAEIFTVAREVIGYTDRVWFQIQAHRYMEMK